MSTGRQRHLLASSRPRPGLDAWLLGVALLLGTFHPSALRAADPPRPAGETLRIESIEPLDGESGESGDSAPEARREVETAWIEPDEVSFSIEMAGDDPPDGHVRTIVHRLENHSRETVCVGRSRTFRVDGRVMEGVVQYHALCGEPLRVLAPGESATWTWTFSGGGCWPDAPAAVLEKKPFLRCGSELELRSRIWLFRFEDGFEQLGGVPIESAPLRFRAGPEMEVGQAIVLEIPEGVDPEGMPVVATLELDWREVGTPMTWEPDLVRLAAAPVHGRLIGPDGEPLLVRLEEP